MTVTINATLIWQTTTEGVAWTAPLINSANTPDVVNRALTDNLTGWEQTTGVTGLYGARLVFTTAQDFTADPYVIFKASSVTWDMPNSCKSIANGGITIYFIDTSGNYSGFYVYGNDITNFDPQDRVSFFSNYGAADAQFVIGRATTPDVTSGTLDWSLVAAVETHTDVLVSSTPSLGFGDFASYDVPLVTGTETIASLSNAFIPNIGTNSNTLRIMCYPTAARYDGSPQKIYSMLTGLNIGDGSTPTNFTDSGFTLGFVNPHSDQGAGFQSLGRVSISDIRLMTINQSATDTVDLSDFTFSSSSNLGVVVTGSTSGTCTFTRGTFTRADSLDLTHSTSDTCIFEDCAYVGADLNTTMTACVIRNSGAGTDEGLLIQSAAGDYTGLAVQFTNNTGDDITIDPPGTGIWDLSGVTTTSGYTINIHNKSATVAITVSLAAGILYTTSTAGGTVTVTTPPVSYNLALPNIVNGSRYQIYNVTTATELTNALTSGGTGVDETYTLGTDYTGGDTGRYRITEQSGVTASEPIDGTFTFSASTTVNSIPQAQVSNGVYDDFGVDGSLITEFSWDTGNIEVDINDTDNITTVQRIAAWHAYFITTATGIDEAYGAMLWESLNSIKIVTALVDILFDNVKVNPLILTGGRIYRDDGTTIISSTSNSIQIDYDPVYQLETGVSGLTGSESTQLSAISTVSTDVWDEVLETGYTAKELQRLQSSILLGKVSGAGSGTETFRDITDNTDRVVATVDSQGNRTAITYDDT